MRVFRQHGVVARMVWHRIVVDDAIVVTSREFERITLLDWRMPDLSQAKRRTPPPPEERAQLRRSRGPSYAIPLDELLVGVR